MNTTTDKENKKRNRTIPVFPIIILTQSLFFLLLWVGSPFLITRISVKKKELEDQVQERESRSKKAWKEEKEKRKKRSIPKAHADDLARQEREKHKKVLRKRINSLIEIKKELASACDEKLKKVQNRKENKERTVKKINTTLKALLQEAEEIAKNDTTKESKELLKNSKELSSKKSELLDHIITGSMLAELEKKENLKSSVLSKKTDADNLFRKAQGELRELKEDIRRHKELAQNLKKNQLDKKRNLTKNLKDQIRNISRSMHKIEKAKDQPELKKLTNLIKKIDKNIADANTSETFPEQKLKEVIDEIKKVSNRVAEKVEKCNNLGFQRSTKSIKNRYDKMKRVAESYRKLLNYLATYKAKREKLFDTAFTKRVNEFSKTLTQAQKEGGNKEIIDSVNRLKKQLTEEAQKDTSQERENTLNRLKELKVATEKLQSEKGKSDAITKKLTLQLDLIKKTIEENIQYRKIYSKEYKTYTDNTQKQIKSFIKENEQEFEKSLGNRENILAKSILKKSNELKELNSKNQSLEANEKMINKLEELADTSQKLDELQKENPLYDKNLPENLRKNMKILKSNFARDMANYNTTRKNTLLPLNQITERIQKNITSLKETNKELQKNYSDVKKSDQINKLVSELPNSPQQLIKDPRIPAILDNAEKRAAESVILQDKAKAPNISKISSFKDNFLTLKELLADSKIIHQDSHSTAILKKRAKNKNALNLTDIKSMTKAAEDLDKSIIEEYATLRAAELALIQDKSFDSMYNAVNKQLTEDHEKITPPENNPEIKTIADLDNYRKSLDETVKKVNNVLRNAKTMQEQAKAIAQKNKRNSLVNSERKSQSILNAIGKRFKNGNSQGALYSGKGDSLHTGKENNKGGMEMVRSIKPREIKIDTKLVKAEALPGRRFTKQSNRKGWIYIDTWYIIGPWENHGRVNWNIRHQPEFDLNLSKTYKGGKNDQSLAWQFSQSQTIRCTPPSEKTNSTYYAYTELFFEEAQNMLIAIASDDAAKVWVNDKLVWEDAELSEWTLDESFQKIAFKKGYNSVMLRIENGPGVCQFSMVLCPEK